MIPSNLLKIDSGPCILRMIILIHLLGKHSLRRGERPQTIKAKLSFNLEFCQSGFKLRRLSERRLKHSSRFCAPLLPFSRTKNVSCQLILQYHRHSFGRASLTFAPLPPFALSASIGALPPFAIVAFALAAAGRGRLWVNRNEHSCFPLTSSMILINRRPQRRNTVGLVSQSGPVLHLDRCKGFMHGHLMTNWGDLQRTWGASFDDVVLLLRPRRIGIPSTA